MNEGGDPCPIQRKGRDLGSCVRTEGGRGAEGEGRGSERPYIEPGVTKSPE